MLKIGEKVICQESNKILVKGKLYTVINSFVPKFKNCSGCKEKECIAYAVEGYPQYYCSYWFKPIDREKKLRRIIDG